MESGESGNNSSFNSKTNQWDYFIARNHIHRFKMQQHSFPSFSCASVLAFILQECELFGVTTITSIEFFVASQVYDSTMHAIPMLFF